MEENSYRGDLNGNFGRESSFRSGGTYKSILSGRSTPKASPSFRRVGSVRTPRKDFRSFGSRFQCFRGNRLVFWLILITLWAYLGFFVQSRWAHDDNEDDLVGYKSSTVNSISNLARHTKQGFLNKSDYNISGEGSEVEGRKGSRLKNLAVKLVKKVNGISSRISFGKRSKRTNPSRRLRSNAIRKQKIMVDDKSSELEQEIPMKNSSYGMIVGPFGATEERVLEWSTGKRSGTCYRKGEFARIVWSRRFLLIFHELSMTGAPISMLELATELLSCGGTVNVVVLDRRGGLMEELNRRKIKVLDDKGNFSFKVAMKADLVIAGSAVCSSWIEQYLQHFAAGSGQIAWWIMENRREYFDRSKHMLNRVKMLVFLSELQSKQWKIWCEEENIQLKSPPMLVPLSVNDELAFVAGIPCSLNSPSYTVEKMLEKRQLLRSAIRKEIGLTDDDMLVMSLSSINPGKGQLLLLQSALLILEQSNSLEDSRRRYMMQVKGKVHDASGTPVGQDNLPVNGKQLSRSLLAKPRHRRKSTAKIRQQNVTSISLNGTKENLLASSNLTFQDMPTIAINVSHEIEKMGTEFGKRKIERLKILIGSVGSKSNKIFYVKEILKLLSQHSTHSSTVLWTPATVHVASLYSAADVYVINAQGIGETFGRVTIEAMAFGLPILGTDAGGTQEIVENNVTGLLHPVGREGNQALARNLQFLLGNPSMRKVMGIRGRNKVENMYLKKHMYQKLAKVFIKCMKIK